MVLAVRVKTAYNSGATEFDSDDTCAPTAIVLRRRFKLTTMCISIQRVQGTY